MIEPIAFPSDELLARVDEIYDVCNGAWGPSEPWLERSNIHSITLPGFILLGRESDAIRLSGAYAAIGVTEVMAAALPEPWQLSRMSTDAATLLEFVYENDRWSELVLFPVPEDDLSHAVIQEMATEFTTAAGPMPFLSSLVHGDFKKALEQFDSDVQMHRSMAHLDALDTSGPLSWFERLNDWAR